MQKQFLSVALMLLLCAAGAASSTSDIDSPAFTRVPELTEGFQLLYEQNFPAAQVKFADWASQNPQEPFGQVAIAASLLFEELYRQKVLTSDFFLNEKRFLSGIEGKPDAERMKHFENAVQSARKLAKLRMERNTKDPEALFALTMAAGMESNADMILKKQNLEALKRLKEANLHAKELLAKVPEADDAYVAMGSANYIIGSLSAGFRAMLWFGGIHGDKKLGMEQLGRTARGGLYLKPFAKIMLALAARREKQDALAQRLLHELNEEFPQSPLFAVEYAKAMAHSVPGARKD